MTIEFEEMGEEKCPCDDCEGCRYKNSGFKPTACDKSPLKRKKNEH